MHTAARSSFDPAVHRGRSRIAASDVYLCSPLLVSLTFSTVSWPYRVAEAHTLASARIFSRSRRPRRARISQADDDGF